MTKPVVQSIHDLARRTPEHGRIRLGEKNKRGGHPQSLEHFRFTSSDQEALERIAQVYGGEVTQWLDGPRAGEYELTTDAREIKVVLPPDPLSGTPIYECWSKAGLLRRCDGIDAEIPRTTPDGAEITETPCVCEAEGVMNCKPKTRLRVILPEVRFGGVWRLESGSWNVAQEMPSMVELIEGLQAKGFAKASLTIEERTRVVRYRDKSGEEKIRTNRFKIPVLRVDGSVEELLSGEATLGGIRPGGSEALGEVADRPALDAPEGEGQDHESYTDDQDHESYVVDAEWEEVEIEVKPTATDPILASVAEEIGLSLSEVNELVERHGKEPVLTAIARVQAGAAEVIRHGDEIHIELREEE